MTDEILDDTPEGAPLRFGAIRPSAKQINTIRHSGPYKRARVDFLAQCQFANKPCGICHEEIDYRLREPHPYSPTLDHIKSVLDAPELIMERNNWQVAHRDCNVRKGSDEAPLDLGVPSELW